MARGHQQHLNYEHVAVELEIQKASIPVNAAR